MMDIEVLIEGLQSRARLKKPFIAPGEIWTGGMIRDELCADAATALSTLQSENEKLRAELERMKEIMRYNGIMVIPSKYPGGRSEWNIRKPRG